MCEMKCQMSSPLLHKYAMPAEVMRGCVFAQNFINATSTDVARNGGTVFGTVSFGSGKGVYCLGTAGNYLSYVSAGVFIKSVISFVIEFWPTYGADDGVERKIIDSDAAGRYTIVKSNISNLFVNYNGTNIIDVALANYQPYWQTGNRNVLVVTCISGNNTAYLNGSLIANTATAWTPADSLSFRVAQLTSGLGQGMVGYISSIKIFTGNTSADLLSLREARSYWRGGYSYV